MSETAKKPMTWVQAFIAVLKGANSKDLATTLKALSAIFALVIFFYTPLAFMSHHAEYGGSRPPVAPLIKAWGTLNYIPSKFPANANPERLEFKDAKGSVFQIDFGRGPQDVYDLVKPGHPGCPGVAGDPGCPLNVYLEGFMLHDGKGPLWPMYIASELGNPLVSRERLAEILQHYDGASYRTSFFMYSVFLILAVYTLFNMYSLKTASAR